MYLYCIYAFDIQLPIFTDIVFHFFYRGNWETLRTFMSIKSDVSNWNWYRKLSSHNFFFRCYDLILFKQITLSIWEEIARISVLSLRSCALIWTWGWKVQLAYFLDKPTEQWDSLLKQEIQDYEKLVSIYLELYTSQHLVNTTLSGGDYSVVFYCIWYTSPAARVWLYKEKSHLLVFNSQMTHSFSIFLFYWLCSSLWSDTIYRTFIKGCWISKCLHF